MKEKNEQEKGPGVPWAGSLRCEAHGVDLVKTPVGFVCLQCLAENRKRAGGQAVGDAESEPVRYRERTVLCCPVHGDDVQEIRIVRDGVLLVGPVCAACLDSALRAYLPALTQKTIREEVDIVEENE